MTAAFLPDRSVSIFDAIGIAQKQLRLAGIESARLDAELLLAFVLDLKRVALYVQSKRVLTRLEMERFVQLIGQRIEGVPIAYLLKEKEFFSLSFLVTPDVLVPRPETEQVVELGLAQLADRGPFFMPPWVLDIGTGSGAIALAMAVHHPQARIVAVDRSHRALQVAQKNAHALRCDVFLLQADGTVPFASPGLFDLVLSNPPYIPTADVNLLPKDVQQEPRLALDGGLDGLRTIRGVVRNAFDLLKSGGSLIMEIGAGQALQVVETMQVQLFEHVQVFRDGSGIERVVLGHKPKVPYENKK